MPIPKEILAVERPKNTIVKKRGCHYVVIKRASRRVGKRVVPVELEAVGEILEGRFVEGSRKRRRKSVDIKDYGEVALCDKLGADLFQELAQVWHIDDAKRLYTIALLRSAYGDVKNRDLSLHYQTSFADEKYPGVHLSEQALSNFLLRIGQEYSKICEFMKNRAQKFAGKHIVIDGMLKDYNSKQGSMAEFSRKARTKGSKDISLMYAYDISSGEPVTAKPYAGNILDQAAIRNFVEECQIRKGLLIFDKGFWNEGLFEDIDKKDGLSYLLPLKQSSAFIRKYEMDKPVDILTGHADAVVLYKNVKMKNGKYLYSFRDPRIASEQEVGYVQIKQKKGDFDAQKYEAKKSLFGLICFQSKSDLAPIDIYKAYAQRWSIEVMFNIITVR